MFKSSRASLAVATLLLSHLLGVLAHMQMIWPLPFLSPHDPAISAPDYDNTSPLKADGSDYPCKGYQNLTSSQVSQTSFTVGETYNMTLAGGATHLGGSCQISLSWDNGRTFKVIKSVIGGCPLKQNWAFTIPRDAISSKNAILAWTWFNIIGNREMYMNCARVSIVGQPTRRLQRLPVTGKRSLDALPATFACNVGNGCRTIEKRELVFPEPGLSIERGVDEVTPDPGPGFTLNPMPTGDLFNVTTVEATATTSVIRRPFVFSNTSLVRSPLTTLLTTSRQGLVQLNVTTSVTVNKSSVVDGVTTTTVRTQIPGSVCNDSRTPAGNTSLAVPSQIFSVKPATMAPFPNTTAADKTTREFWDPFSTHRNFSTPAPWYNVTRTMTAQTSATPHTELRNEATSMEVFILPTSHSTRPTAGETSTVLL